MRPSQSELSPTIKPDAAVATKKNPAQATVQDGDMNFGEPRCTRIVTTSWDDGDPFDLQVAELLAARKLAGTFYIPVNGHHLCARMSFAEMFELNSRGFEIGAHGVSHVNLSRCDKKQLIVEVESCKKRLEDDLGKKVSMFAYPGGRHNNEVIASLKQAGYAGGRTTAMLANELKFDPFRMPTSVHVYPHSRLDYIRNLARGWDRRRAWVCATHLRCTHNWVELAKALFDWVMQNGGLWHLYGHSWEIEELRLWDGLKEVLNHVSNRRGVLYLANGPVVNLRVAKSVVAECCSEILDPEGEGPGIHAAGERRVGV